MKSHKPYYDRKRKCWQVDFPDRDSEEGDLLYVVSEFARTGLYFPYNNSQTKAREYSGHDHSFEGVIQALLNDPEGFSIEGFEDYYSAQEREMLSAVKRHLLQENSKGGQMKIYFDMDGVLANFAKGIRDFGGFDPAVQGESNEKLDDLVWDVVRATEHFYDRLEPIPGSFELLRKVYAKYGDDCQILSAVPKPKRNNPTAGDDKRKWVARLLSPDIKVNIVLRKEKSDYCKGADSILIDDYDKNIAEWNAMGGTGILFSSAKDVETRLKALGIV